MNFEAATLSIKGTHNTQKKAVVTAQPQVRF